MKTAIDLVYRYFLKPDQISFSDQTTTARIKWILFLLAFEMPFILFAGFIQSLLFKNGLIDSQNHLTELISKEKLMFVPILILIIPAIEELIFRLPLRFKKINFIPFIIFTTSLAGLLIFKKVNLPVIMPVLLVIIITGLLFFLVFHKKTMENFENFLHTNYPFYFYSLAILFALFHLGNFSFSISLLLFAPVIVLPQFIAGFFMGFIRIKQGFIWGFIFHAMHNAIFILPMLLAISITKPKLIEKINKNDYTFEVYEGYHFIDNKTAKPKPGFSDSKVTPNEIVLFGTFKNVVSILTYTKKRQIFVKNGILANKVISLYFRNDSAARQESAYLSSKLAFENLLNSYNLKTKTESRRITVWRLSVNDENIFKTHFLNSGKVKSNKTRNFIEVRDTLKFHEINSDFLVKAMEIAFDTEIQNDIDNNLVFSIEIPNNDFKNLKHYLETKYGLTIESRTEKRAMLVIF